MRLDKAVTYARLSRSEAGKAIRQGRVRVNGSAVTNAGRAVAPEDEITLDGARVAIKLHTHYMLNKPAGVITATQDARGERTVLDLIAPADRIKGLGPAGRLDKDVTGLVILTSDGQLAHRLISPARGISKEYTAYVAGVPDESDINAFGEGLELGDFRARPAHLRLISAGGGNALCRIEVTEGKYHEVKRMFEKTGHPVLALSRRRIAGLTLDETLPQGAYRQLTDDEEALLYAAAGMETP